jgi:hypothetical protein
VDICLQETSRRIVSIQKSGSECGMTIPGHTQEGADTCICPSPCPHHWNHRGPPPPSVLPIWSRLLCLLLPLPCPPSIALHWFWLTGVSWTLSLPCLYPRPPLLRALPPLTWCLLPSQTEVGRFF